MMRTVTCFTLAACALGVPGPTLAGQPPVRKAEAVARAYVAELKANPGLWPDTGEKEVRKRFARDIEDRDAPRVGLEALLSDPDAEVRQSAANLLGRLRDKRAAPALIASLKDKSERVRSTAAISLGNLGDRTATPSLIELLKKDPDGLVRRCVGQAFEAMPDPRAVPSLVEALRKDDEPDVRRNAAQALGKIGGDEAVAALEKGVLEADHRVRAYCEDALERLKRLSLPLPEEVYTDIFYDSYEQLRKAKRVFREVRKAGKIYFEYEEIREMHFPTGHGWFSYRYWCRCEIPKQE